MLLRKVEFQIPGDLDPRITPVGALFEKKVRVMNFRSF